jgi:hypothetical protein
MKHVSRYTLAVIAALALLAGCGGQVAPTGGVPQSTATHGKSWMLPEAKGIKELLYVSDGLYDVYVYDYKTGAEVGMLSGFNRSAGQCVDAKGDVWIANDSSVVEYAHGGAAPLKTFSTEDSVGCSVDPTSGNLAVAEGTAHTILIFKHASGNPTVYKASQRCAFELLPPGYDDKGNLYMEAWRGHSNNVCELPHGAAKIKGPISTGSLVLGNYGTVMWDGKYITLAEDDDYYIANAAVIHQMKEDASGGLTEVGETVLSQNCNVDVPQPFIVGTKNTPDNHTQGTAVVGTNTHCGEYETVFYWAYPSGGNPTKAFAPGAAGWGDSVSIAP